MSKLDRLVWAASSTYHIGPLHLGIRTDSEWLNEALQEALADYYGSVETAESAQLPEWIDTAARVELLVIERLPWEMYQWVQYAGELAAGQGTFDPGDDGAVSIQDHRGRDMSDSPQCCLAGDQIAGAESDEIRHSIDLAPRRDQFVPLGIESDADDRDLLAVLFV